MKYTINYCKNNRVVIEVTSEEELQQIRNICNSICSGLFADYHKPASESGYNRIAFTCINTWCSVKYFEENGCTVISAQQFIQDNTERRFKVGDKVVPISKSKGTMSSYITKGLKKQGYLYVTRLERDTSSYGHIDYTCNIIESGSGDFFMESDLIPYVEEFVLPEKWKVAVKENLKFFNDLGRNLSTTACCGYITSNPYLWKYPTWGYWMDSESCEDYQEISFEQFKKYVLKQDDMLTELPKAWFVKNDGSQLFKDTVIKYLKDNYGKEYAGNASSASYGVEEDNSANYWHDLKHFGKAVELTLEQFIQLTSKKEMKEIIGYKLKDDCKQYEDAAREIEPFAKKPFPNGILFSYNSSTSKSFEKAGVLDLWFEPIHGQDEFKVGDWVVVLAEDDYYLNSEKCSQRLPHTNSYTNVRKATQEEIQNYLVSLAKKKGFVEGLKLKDVISPSGTTHHTGVICKNWDWEYYSKTNTLKYCSVTIYENGVWATITSTEKVVSVGGKFDVKIKDGEIYHKSDNITTFVKELINFFSFDDDEFGGYKAIVKDIVFSKTGCQNVETKLSDWKEVMDEYNKLQK